MPIRNRVQAQNVKSKSFQDLFTYYKPLIDAKNATESKDIAGKNVFDDNQHRSQRKFISPAGEVKVNHFLKPFELRLFDLRKQAYTI